VIQMGVDDPWSPLFNWLWHCFSVLGNSQMALSTVIIDRSLGYAQTRRAITFTTPSQAR
jgi:hypothetical protein